MAKSKPLPKKAAVIGSGFGGLGAAIRLQSAGIQTVLYGSFVIYQVEGPMFTMMMVTLLMQAQL